MATEYKLSYTASEIDERLAMVSQLSSEKVDYNQGTANVGKMLIVGADGNLTLSDIPENVSGDIIGVLDENNNIVITGELAGGTYVFKYETADGTYADIGSLVVGGVVQYSITTTLTECTAVSGNATVINEGGTVTLKYTAKDGFALTDTVTVSGASYTWDSATGTLVLSNPIADVTVAITATKSGVTNLADPTATGWINNSRIGSDGTPKAEGACQGAVVTNYILIPNRSKTVYIKGLDIVNNLPDNNVTIHSRYSAIDESTYVGKFFGSAIASLVTVTGNITQIAFGNQILSGEYIRLTGTLLDGYTASDVVITYDEPITE